MVDLVALQSLSYMAGAIGVCIAAIYYILNLREVKLNRRITFTSGLLQSIESPEGAKNWIKLMNLKWKDLNDFKARYDSAVNEEIYVARATYFGVCEIIGFQFRRGLIDLETVYETAGEPIIDIFLKYKPIFDEYKRIGEYGKDVFTNFEYLAYKMAEMKSKRDPSYKGAYQYFGGPEAWNKTFSKK